MTCLEHHHLATGSAIGENELMDNAFEEAPSPSHHRRSAVALAPEQRSPPKAGFTASIYIKRCRATVELVKGESFTKLLGALVESVLLYGAEVWGCGRHATLVEQIQLRAARIFLGVSRLHPKAALQYEMKMMPVTWEAKRRCIEFWLTVLRMSDDRLV